MDVMLTGKRNYDELMEWFDVQPEDVLRDFPIPKELIVPKEGLSKACIEELLSDNPDEYLKGYAEVLNKYYNGRLRWGGRPEPHDKEWCLAFNFYDAPLFDVERYTESLREITDDNRWCFDKVELTQSGEGEVFLFRRNK